MINAGFQSAHILEKAVEGLTNVLHPEDDDTKDNLFQMENATSQSKKILPELVQQMQQIQTLMAQMQTQLKNNNENGVNDNKTGVGNKSNKVLFWRQLY